MFEFITKTEEALAEEKRSPEQNASLRLAGTFLMIAGGVGLMASLILPSFAWSGGPLMTLACGFYLYRLQPHAEAMALALALLNLAVFSIAFVAALPLRTAILACVPAWASAAATLLLIAGRQSRFKRIIATVLYLPSASAWTSC